MFECYLCRLGLSKLALCNSAEITWVGGLACDSGDGNIDKLTNVGLCLLPVSDLGRLNYNEFDSWIFGCAVMDTIAEITEPSGNHWVEDFLNSGLVAARVSITGDGDPVGRALVVEAHVDLGVGVNFVE